MFDELIAFIKNPAFRKNTHLSFEYKLFYMVKLALLAICISIGLSLIAAFLEHIFSLELGKHAIDDLFDNYSALGIFFFGVVLAPFLEELLFRGPLVWFKDSTYFRPIFYLVAVLFGYIHITNFELSTTVLVLSPLLVAPQISVGLLLGLIRVKFGLSWSMAMHALYNLILITPLVLVKVLNIPLE